MINLENLSWAVSKKFSLVSIAGPWELKKYIMVDLIQSENSVKNNNVHKCDGSVDLACE